MELGIIEAAVALVSGGVGAGLTYKFFSDKLAVMEANMKELVKSESCNMRHKAQEDKCGMVHGNLRETLDRIDKKFEEICDQIEGLRADRKSELNEMTALLRELLNEGGKKR